LLSYAADIGADLLVCGMYGHSRLHELAFGGVTRSLLAEMTLPVFMVH
jgi:nucleotide-binding universal stress UspA family protein